MEPFFNPNDIQSYIENMRKTFMNGEPFNTEDVQKKVMESLDQFLPDFLKQGKASSATKADAPSQRTTPTAQSQVFETHDFVIARIPIRPDNYYPPKILMDTYHLYVRGLPEQESELKLQLPAPIRPKNAKAEYKDGVLEVRMLKRGPEPFTEINVSDM
ncbi:spore germination protein GerT [Pullulanibacillus camelliae]|uniref:Spore germination protein GerT n=1 Tax=Pullulanibacillus camelliae TaxID=1707096 RepID=A0A8J2YKL4_9BACL|nr:hypothetical protein [Pullulanibacillus camelliae]GGE48883.1 spore germination protein GerT [Pullulanibacillus camelliae]